jgi:hypothetical protein
MVQTKRRQRLLFHYAGVSSRKALGRGSLEEAVRSNRREDSRTKTGRCKLHGSLVQHHPFGTKDQLSQLRRARKDCRSRYCVQRTHRPRQ